VVSKECENERNGIVAFLDCGSYCVLYAPSPGRTSAEAVGAYEVREGDNILSIARMFGLKPDTIFLNNYDLLQEEHALNLGMVLTILPIDGIYYQWQEGHSIESVAAQFAVEPLTIVA
jgi:hypothetical protein